jgi:hypothetical protein
VTVVYFQTLGDGTERLLDGRAYATYFDASNSQTFYGPGSDQAEVSAGEGFFTLLFFPQSDQSDATRVTMDFTFRRKRPAPTCRSAFAATSRCSCWAEMAPRMASRPA